MTCQEQHYIYLQRDSKRVPIAGPYADRKALETDLPRIEALLEQADRGTWFDGRIFGKTSDAATIEANNARINKVFPQGNPISC